MNIQTKSGDNNDYKHTEKVKVFRIAYKSTYSTNFLTHPNGTTDVHKLFNKDCTKFRINPDIITVIMIFGS